MDDKDLIGLSRAVVSHMVHADDAYDAMGEIVKALCEEPDLDSQDMLKVLTGAIIMMAQSLTTAADKSIAAIVPMLVLLYPHLSPKEILAMGAEMLTHKPRVSRMVHLFGVLREL